MRRIYTFYFVQFFLYYHVQSSVSQSSQHFLFTIQPNSVYIPQFSPSFLVNLTDNTIINEKKCAERCFYHHNCQTAVYYTELKVCSLFYEKSSVGQITTQMGSSVVAIKSREPTICVISSQSTWSLNSMVVIGNLNGSAGSTLSTLNNPKSIYYDLYTRELLVGDTYNSRVIKFSRDNLSGDGIIVAGGNGIGSSLNQFHSVDSIALDSIRQLYVADTNANRVMKFPADSNSSTYGQIISTITQQPSAICIDHRNDDIYVFYTSMYAVMKFVKNSTVGVIVAGGNGWGSALNQLTWSLYIYFDYVLTNALYVSDYNNNRVMKFPANSTNATFGTLVAGGGPTGTAMNETRYPLGITGDINGILYIADGNGRVQRWLPNATSGETVASGLFGTPEYFYVQDIAFDENYNMFAAETWQNRIRLVNITSC